MTELVHTKEELAQMQSLPLEQKIQMSQRRVREWYEYWNGNVFLSFSGGKDSTVLKHLVDQIYDDIPAMYVDTGLEYPEIRAFVKDVKGGKYDCFNTDVEILRPEMRFDEVIKEYGYPIGSKKSASMIEYGRRARESGDVEKFNRLVNGHPQGREARENFNFMPVPKWMLPLVDSDFKVSAHCCEIMKKRPLRAYHSRTGRYPILGTMAYESDVREKAWRMVGCNSYGGRKQRSAPLSFWTEQDVLQYIKRFNVPYCSVYGEIVERGGVLQTTNCNRTGCMFCMFGIYQDKKPNRFQRMEKTHPKQYEYCMKPVEEGGLGLKEILDYVGIPVE